MSKAGCQPVQQEEPDQDELVGLRNEKAFQREEYARTRKFHKFGGGDSVVPLAGFENLRRLFQYGNKYAW